MTGAYGALMWLIIAVMLFIIEGATVQLICVWFAGGALVAMAASAFGAPLWLQLLLFLLTSIAVLFMLRPILRRKLQIKKIATNAEMVIGQIGVVKEEIDNIKQTGRVHANGLDWTARAFQDALTIREGSRVRAMAIEGVKLIVAPVEGGEDL